MTRPASLRRQGSPFVRQKRKAGSKPIEINYERVEFSFNHRLETDLNIESLQRLRRELQDAEDRLGADSSRAKKIRREINRQLEQGLFIQGTWCGSCLRVLHRCKCPSLLQVTDPTGSIEEEVIMDTAVRVVHRILRQARGREELTGKEKRALKRQQKEALSGNR